MDTSNILGVLQLFMFLVEEIANPHIKDVLITLLSVSIVFINRGLGHPTVHSH